MKRGTPRHPKLLDLCDKLHIDVPTAVGYLELLWHFTAEAAPQGNIGRYTDARIEAACCFKPNRWRRAGDLIKALCDCHWIESDPYHRLLVHDWSDHADGSVRRKLERRHLPFLKVSDKVTGQNADNVRTTSSLPSHSLALSIIHSPTDGQHATAAAYPQTLEMAQKYDQSIGIELIARLIRQTMESFQQHPEISAAQVSLAVSDQYVAQAVNQSYQTYQGRSKHGPGLLLKRVPQILVAACKVKP